MQNQVCDPTKSVSNRSNLVGARDRCTCKKEGRYFSGKNGLTLERVPLDGFVATYNYPIMFTTI